MEVAPGIYRIEVPLGERVLYTYLLAGQERTLLVDTGQDRTPYERLAPYFSSIGRSVQDLGYVVITHSDWDHQGGNVSLKEIAPQALFMCHELDRPLIESINQLIEERYREFQKEHEIDENDEAKIWIRQNNRSEVSIGLTLLGGETLKLDQEWDIKIWHTPGHTKGHLSLYDARSRVAIIADAALWNCIPTADGRASLPPTYRYVDTYLSTINALMKAPIETLLTGHYPVLRGPEVADFLQESREFVNRLESQLIRELSSAKSARTARQLIENLSPRLGSWTAEAGIYLDFPVVGHLERMERLDRLEKISRRGAVQFKWKS